MKSKSIIGLIVILCISLIGCSSAKFDIAGMWEDTDGTIRTFNSNGTCLDVAKIDIGGPSPTYALSEEEVRILFIERSAKRL